MEINLAFGLIIVQEKGADNTVSADKFLRKTPWNYRLFCGFCGIWESLSKTAGKCRGQRGKREEKGGFCLGEGRYILSPQGGFGERSGERAISFLGGRPEKKEKGERGIFIRKQILPESL